jgi:hypothetical protein
MNQIFVSFDGARYLVEYEGTIEVTCLAGVLMLAGSLWSVTEIDWTAGRIKIEGRHKVHPIYGDAGELIGICREEVLSREECARQYWPYWHGLPPFVRLDLKPAPWWAEETSTVERKFYPPLDGPVVCPQCDGFGKVGEDEPETCGICHGLGRADEAGMRLWRQMCAVLARREGERS